MTFWIWSSINVTLGLAMAAYHNGVGSWTALGWYLLGVSAGISCAFAVAHADVRQTLRGKNDQR